MGRVYLADVFDYERRAIRRKGPVGEGWVGIRLFRVPRRLVPGARRGEAVCCGDVQRHQIQRRLLESGGLWKRGVRVVGMADSAVEKEPFCGGWAVDGLGVVYGGEERLEGDGLRGGENGHGRGEDGMVVVIEQVLLSQIRV